jgi:hypothetical protein
LFIVLFEFGVDAANKIICFLVLELPQTTHGKHELLVVLIGMLEYKGIIPSLPKGLM